jgi:3',5'-cyclic AMP phosphodiesterase CpdA
MFVLAHLSDPHLAPLPAPRFSELASKRLTGFLNWQRKRRDIHDADMLERLVEDLRLQGPDHVAVLGDLANLSLPEEFVAGRRWLTALGRASDVTVVPGNHDAYVHTMRTTATRAWANYMRGDEEADIRFPFIRRRGPVALVGLSSAIPTAPFRATGKIGADQLQRLKETLALLATQGVFRIVMIHHPPQSEPGRESERLLDGAAFIAVLAEAGAELVLHGHEHINSVSWLAGPDHRRIPVIGVPSASAIQGGHWEAAGYNLYHIDGRDTEWRCRMVSRAANETGAIVETGQRQIVWR